jgi:hypothetical protein
MVELADELGERTTVAGDEVAFRPVRDVTAVRFTSPEKPFSPVRVTVEVPDEPAWMLRVVGLAVIVNPVTSRLTGVEREIGPLIPCPLPVTVTV